MFLSLLQFFATKFLYLALHLDSGSFPRPLTQLETARLLQISRSYVSRLETHALELLKAGWEQAG